MHRFNQIWIQVHLLDKTSSSTASVFPLMQAMHLLLLLYFLSAEPVAAIFIRSRSTVCQEINSTLTLSQNF